ncbi:hypothetical protein L345_04435, partial [Ophiophagus hannah]
SDNRWPGLEEGIKQGRQPKTQREFLIEPAVYYQYFYITTVLNWRVRILAYAGDISLSTSQLGLHRQLKKFNMYYLENDLVINYMKSKEVGFGKKRKQHKWFLNFHKIEQVGSFLYLVIVFSSTGSRIPYIKMDKLKTVLNIDKANVLFVLTVSPKIWVFVTTKGIESAWNWCLPLIY